MEGKDRENNDRANGGNANGCKYGQRRIQMVVPAKIQIRS